MANFQHQNVNFHYQEMGQGEAIIALHGLCLNTKYWMNTGVAQSLAKHYRVIALDMRAHGLTTIEGDAKGYDIETMMMDIDALADHLQLDKFHLLSHSTGGMIASRYATKQSRKKHNRLLSLIISNSSSATKFMNSNFFTDGLAMEMLAQSIENLSWRQIVEGLKFIAGPLFSGIAKSGQSSKQFEKVHELMCDGNHRSIAQFIRRFYNDPDPHLEKLANIKTPTLVLSAQWDSMFIKSSRLIASTIPNAKFAMCERAGHMLAIESPKWLVHQIEQFLDNTPNQHVA